MNDEEYIAKARAYARTLGPQDAVHVYGLIHRLEAANADASYLAKWLGMTREADEWTERQKYLVGWALANHNRRVEATK